MVVEQREPHAGRMAFADVEQPATFAARCELAKRMRDELEVPLPIYVDGMDDASRALFSDLPSPAFLIGRDGRIVDKLPWADPAPLAAALAAVLDKAVTQDKQLPAQPTAALLLEQREALARRLVDAGKAEQALAWLDVALPAATAGLAPQSAPATLARAAIVRALALQGAKDSERTAAIEVARTAIAAAWGDDPARATAARIELAGAVADVALAAAIWRDAYAGLDPRAPELTRAWLSQRVAPDTRVAPGKSGAR